MHYRNRIIDHLRIRAGDLVAHPLNFRRHPEGQRRALVASYEEVGEARSLLGYRLSDGRIGLIDGHLRQELDPNMEVTVEVLDVNEDEARKLLLTLDPLAALAETDSEVVAKLQQLVETDRQALADLWKKLAASEPEPAPPDDPPAVKEQYLILVECRDEAEQVELLKRFHDGGLKCKALLS
jgi:hypothetical protein